MPLARLFRVSPAAQRGALRRVALVDRPESASRLGAETKRRRLRRRLVRRGSTPGVFRSTEPAWNDANLRELAGHISSAHFFAHIRAAIGSAVQQTNCHPFRDGHWLFMHNGYINEFQELSSVISCSPWTQRSTRIQGQADTEVLFFLALTFGLAGRPAVSASSARSGSSRWWPAAMGFVDAFQGTVATTDGERHLGGQIFDRWQIPLVVLQHRRADPARALSRAPAVQGRLGRRENHRVRAARRCPRRLERGARIHMRHHWPRPR